MGNASGSQSDAAYDGCTIPPEVYDIGLGWDSQPEINRLLFLAREAGATVRSALELGCGTGRLLAAMPPAVERVVGIELSEAMAALAGERVVAARTEPRAAHAEPEGADAIVAGDMTDFDLGCRFDLIYTSANTIRHILDDEALARFWRCVAAHLASGGVFVADTELGVEYEREQVGKPAVWTIARGEKSVRATWEVVDPPSTKRPRSGIRWRFELEDGGGRQSWDDRFELRARDAAEFAARAVGGGLRLGGLYELRDPYLLEQDPERFEGRALVVFGRA